LSGRSSRLAEALPDSLEGRKADHIRICLEEDVQARFKSAGFEDITFVHRALPEIDREEVNLSTSAFDHGFSAPVMVEAMTGGTREASGINAAIAEAVERLGLGMGVGSQRAAIENPELEGTFAVAREKAPTAFLAANIGGPQVAREYGVEEAERAVEMIEADALAVHLNPLQEAVQPEGETGYRGVLEKIGEIARALKVPVIVKETGAGVAAEEARGLEAAGVRGVDVAGAGGTSWAAVEFHRARGLRDAFGQRLGETFWDWGIPTVASVVEVAQSARLTVVASGGVRSGLDAAKALALGAGLAGVALPVLGPAVKGPGEVERALRLMVEELRTAMFLVRAPSLRELKGAPLVITGKTAEWLRLRGFQPETYARRKI